MLLGPPSTSAPHICLPEVTCPRSEHTKDKDDNEYGEPYADARAAPVAVAAVPAAASTALRPFAPGRGATGVA